MKKNTVLTIMAIFLVCILSACGKNYSYEESSLETVVIECEEGTFCPEKSYLTLANMYLAKKKMAMWNVYMNLANANGKYEYNITISIDGKDYIVIREEPYEVGTCITITELKTYQDSELIKTEYK